MNKINYFADRCAIVISMLLGVLNSPIQTLASPTTTNTTTNQANALIKEGRKYEEGDGVKEDLKQAVALYKKSFALGSSEAAWRLSCIYYGTSKEKNSEEEVMGLEWCKRAAALNHPEALYYMGNRYSQANGGMQSADHHKAFIAYEKSAKFGFTKASYQLGRLYKDGLGCKPDTDKAIACFAIAANGGMKNAADQLVEIYSLPKYKESGQSEKLKWQRYGNQIKQINSELDHGWLGESNKSRR